ASICRRFSRVHQAPGSPPSHGIEDVTRRSGYIIKRICCDAGRRINQSLMPVRLGPVKPTGMKRLLWLDIAKAIAICWVVYFHFFNTVFEHTQFPAEDWTNLAAGTVTVIRMMWLKISGIGFHAVGVFIILGGWALMESTARRAESSSLKW